MALLVTEAIQRLIIGGSWVITDKNMDGDGRGLICFYKHSGRVIRSGVSSPPSHFIQPG